MGRFVLIDVGVTLVALISWYAAFVAYNRRRGAAQLDVLRRRWSGHSVKKSTSASRVWEIVRPGPVILTTKDEWPPELTPLVNALTSWRDKDFLSVRFKPTSPHFTACGRMRSGISMPVRRWW